VQETRRPAPAVVAAGAIGRLARFGLTAVAAACLFVLGGVPARADGSACQEWDAALEANGGVLAIPKSAPGRPLDILAIGSSSTEGVGASSPKYAYPSALEEELERDDGISADVRNAGVGGELAAKTLPRLLAALKSGWARLVIWQVGTNDALVGVDEASFRATVESGVAAARAAGVSLVLMDPQYINKSPNEPRYKRFVAIIHDIGARLRVPVVARYATMQKWGVKTRTSLLANDGLHMNDLGYRCVAHAVAEAIEDALASKL